MAERSPSSDLPSRHAERSAALAGAKALPGGSPDAPVPAAEALDQLRADVCPSATAASGASDAALQASQRDAADHHPALAGGVAEKLADLVPDVREPDATFPQPEPQLARWAQPAEAAELCTPAVAQSAARSCAAKESAAQSAQVDAARTLVLALKQEMELAMEPAAKQQTPKPEARLARPAPQAAQSASKPPEGQTPASQPERESRTAAEQPALLAVQEPCSQIRQAQQVPWPPEARRLRACWQPEARKSPRADSSLAAPRAPQAPTQPLSAA